MDKLKIAVVDDDNGFVEKLCLAVELAGFEAIPVFVAEDRTKGYVLKMIRGAQVILLDHSMPRFSGEDIAKLLSYDDDPPVLITTSDHDRAPLYTKHFLIGKGNYSPEGLSDSIRRKVGEICESSI